MKPLMAMAGGLCMAVLVQPGLAAAETLRSESYEAELVRRPVAMTAKSGKAIAAEQVHVTLRRRDGRPIGTGQLGEHVPFAERAACQGRPVLVSLTVGASGGAGKFEVLCGKAN